MLAEQVDAHHHQLLVIQEAVKHLPTSGEMHRIEIGLTALRGETNATDRHSDGSGAQG